MRTPPGLLGRLVVCDFGGKLHIADPRALDWHHQRLRTFCGRWWSRPKATRRWAEVDEDEICKTCLRSSQVWETTDAEKHRHLLHFLKRH